jgi:hypothetical protein
VLPKFQVMDCDGDSEDDIYGGPSSGCDSEEEMNHLECIMNNVALEYVLIIAYVNVCYINGLRHELVYNIEQNSFRKLEKIIKEDIMERCIDAYNIQFIELSHDYEKDSIKEKVLHRFYNAYIVYYS